MPLRREAKEIVSIFTGQKSSLPHGVLQPSDAERVENFVCRKGKLRKIWGASLYAQPVFANGSGGIKWIDYFRDRWIYQQGKMIAYEDSEGAKTFTELGTLTEVSASAGTVRSDKWINRIYMVSGIENKFYEDSDFAGAKFLTLGITPPGNGQEAQADLSSTTFAGAGLFPGSKYYQYLLTWYDHVREIESLPNGATVDDDGLWSGTNVLQIGPTTANDMYRISVAALKGDGYDTDRVTAFFLYRREVDSSGNPVSGSSFKRISTLSASPEGMRFDISADKVDDTYVDNANGVVLDQSISPPPSGRYSDQSKDLGNYGPRFVRYYRDQLWLFGVRYPGDVNRSYYPVSGIAYASDVRNFDHWLYQYDIGRATDQEDTGIAKYRNTLMFFKESSAYYLDGTNPNNYTIREMDTQRGVVAPGSVQETPIGVIGLAADGFVLFDSASPGRLLTDEIFDEIEGINFDQIDKIHSAYNKKEGKYECYLPTGSNTNISKVFIYDVNLKVWQFLTTRTGLSTAYGLSSKKRTVGLLGDSSNSRLYLLTDESQTTFNGQTIHAKWYSKHFDFGEPDKQKRLQTIKIKARAKTSFRISIDLILDFGQQETISLENLDPEEVVSTWAASASDADGDELVWDSGAWNANTVPVKFEVLAQCVARNIQAVIRESETDAERASFEIEEIILSANMLGR